MKHFILSITLLIITSPFLLYANEATYEQHIARGISELEANNFRVAIDEFKASLREKPSNLMATLYLGIALSRSGDREAEAILKKALSMNSIEPRTNLELGIYYYNKAMFDEARDYLENTIRLAPKTEFSAKAEEYLRAMKGVARPWALNISVGTQYDSNVVLNSTSNPLPQGITRKSDWRAVLYLKGRYNIIKKEGAEGSIGYSLYQSLHGRLSDFNVTQHLLELRGAYDFSPSLRLEGVYSFEYVYLGGDEYDYAHSISPSLVISEGKGFSTAIEYRYRDIHFKDSELFVNNSDRTGSNNLIGITQSIPLTGSISARVGYSHDEDSTRKDYWDYSGDKGFVGMRFNMQYRILLDLYGEYYSKGYEGINPISNSKRKDVVHTYSGAITKGLTDRCSITIGQSYTRNRSNISAYDYKRAITSLFLNARF